MKLRKEKKLILNFEENKMEEGRMIELILGSVGVLVLFRMFGFLLMEELTGGRR